MATQVQWRGGSTAEHSTFTGAAREVTVDTQKQTLVLHDGSTAGGRALLREDGSNAALALGSAATPSLKFTGDPNTGIYSPGADQLALSTNGTGRLFVDASGNVGVGVLSPTSTNGGLDISSGGLSLVLGANNSQSSRTDAQLKTSRIASFHYTNAEKPVALAVVDSTSTANLIYFGGSTSSCTAATNIAFYTAANNTTATGSERMRITSAGLVGIGTSSPAAQTDIRCAAASDNLLLGTTDIVSSQGGSVLFGGYGGTYFGSIRGGLTASAGNTTGFLAISTRNATTDSSLTERLRITTGGQVGIGTTSPAYSLVVSAASANIEINDSTSPDATSETGIRFSNNATTHSLLGRFGSQDFRVFNTGNIVFATDGVGAVNEKARLDTSGRLLVGTSTTVSTDSIFQVNSTSPANLVELSRQANDASPVTINFVKNRGSATTSVNNNDFIGMITFKASDGVDMLSQAGRITCEVDGAPGANDMPGRLVFSTTADGASSPTERMRITNNGSVRVPGSLAINRVETGNNVLSFGTFDSITGAPSSGTGNAVGTAFIVGNTSGASGVPSYLSFHTCVSGTVVEGMRLTKDQELLVGYTTDNGAYKLQVNSQIFATSSTIATSDGRYKENVATLGDCVDLVKALRPVSFTWKPQQDITRTDENGNEVLVREGHNFPDGAQVGFIAQEVQEVLADKPWLTSVIKENVRPAVTDPDGNELAPKEEFLGIAEGNLIAVLTSALQEAIGEIEALKARVAALESA